MRIVIAASDHQLRAELRDLLEVLNLTIVCEIGDMESLIDCVATMVPDAILVDCNLPNFYPDLHLTALRFFGLGARVVVLCEKKQLMPYTMKMGADGFVSRNELANELPSVLRSFGTFPQSG